MTDTLNVVFSVNKKYMDYLAVVLESMWRNNEGTYFNCYIVSSDIVEDDLTLLHNSMPAANGEFCILRITDKEVAEVEKIYRVKHEFYPVETDIKVLLAWMLPQNVKRALFLDADVVINGNLSQLYHMDFEGNCIIGARDITLEHISTVNQERMVNYLKTFPPQSYLNTGMLLLNVEKIRNEFTVEDLYDAAEEMDYFRPWPWPDMVIYNHVFREKIKFVDPFRYHLQIVSTIYEVFEEKMDIGSEKNQPIIIHYISKPWNFKDTFFTNIYKIWWKYARYTSSFEKWNEQLIDGMNILVQKKKFDRSREILIERGEDISVMISSFFEKKGFKRIGVYGAGEYGVLFAKDMPSGYEYLFFDQKVKQLEGMPVFDPDEIEKDKIDVLVVTPFYFEELRYELYSKYNVPIYTYDFILNDYIYKPMEN